MGPIGPPYVNHERRQTQTTDCIAESYILADAAIAAVASSIWDREARTLCVAHIVDCHSRRGYENK